MSLSRNMKPQVCGFCCEVVETAESLSHRMSKFLEETLRVSAASLPAKMCSECHRRATTARKFTEKCHKSIQKLERTGVKGGMTVGRSRSQLPVGTGGVEYSLKVHGPLKFPKISLTAEDRARAEDHLAMVRRREKEVRRSQEDHLSDLEDEEGEEVFPAVGPFECEICQVISNTKQDFVNHIKVKHRDSVDQTVLRTLETDLKKREKKFLRRSAEAKIRPKRKQKQTKRSLKLESDSDEEFLPVKKKFLQEVEYRDEKGNILPKTAAKCPAVCEVCGKNISRAGDMLKHRQTLTCRTNLRDSLVQGSSRLVVTVPNYQGEMEEISQSPVTRSQAELAHAQGPPAPVSQDLEDWTGEVEKKDMEDKVDWTVEVEIKEMEERNCEEAKTKGKKEFLYEKLRALDTVLRETVESWQKEENDVNSNLVRSQLAEVIEDLEEDYEERDLVIDEQARDQVLAEDQ